MPTIDEINQAAFLNRQLDLYLWAIDILSSGYGTITVMTVASKIVEGVAPPQPPIVQLSLMPPIDDQNVMNVTAEAFQLAADKITQILTDMGFAPSTEEGRKNKQIVPPWMVPMGAMSLNGGARDASAYNYNTSPAPPPNFAVFPYQNLNATTPVPPAPIPPQYPVTTPPPPEAGSPADQPPSTVEGQPPTEFPSEPPTTTPPEQPDTTPPDIPPP